MRVSWGAQKPVMVKCCRQAFQCSLGYSGRHLLLPPPAMFHNVSAQHFAFGLSLMKQAQPLNSGSRCYQGYAVLLYLTKYTLSFLWT